MIPRASTGGGHSRTNTVRRQALAIAALAAVVLCAATLDGMAAARVCKPPRARSPVVLKDMGPCAFDAERASFAGDPAQQAACLLRSTSLARLGPPLESIPAGSYELRVILKTGSGSVTRSAHFAIE